VQGENIGVLDIEKGEVVVTQKVGKLTWPTLRFNPTGNKIACIDHSRVKVWNFLTGELLIDLPKMDLPSGGFRFVGENHLLVSGQALYDISNKLVIWKYEGAAAVEEFGEYSCFVAGVGSKNTGTIFLERVPHSDVTETLSKAMQEPDFWVLAKGTKVRLNLDGIPDPDRRDKIRAAFTKKLSDQGCHVGEDGSIELVATVKESEKKKEVSYGRFPGGFSRDALPFKLREFTSRVQFVYQGKSAWEQTATNIPSGFSLKEGESVNEVLERHEKPNYYWFEQLEFPPVLRKPTDAATLGVTKVTTAGLK
jgi:hypothetical protein